MKITKKQFAIMFLESVVITTIGKMLFTYGSIQIVYYLVALIVLFVFWYGLFELMKK